MKIKKALFVGLGSIGQRHLQNLKLLRPEIEVIAYRTSFNQDVIKEGKKVPNCKISDYGLIEYRDLDKALKQKPDIGFVCNPSNLHLETAIKLAEYNCHLFIEKPLDISAAGLYSLENLIKKNNLITMVGYQTRFHPAVKKIKSIIDQSKVISANFLWHTYLPNHHPYEDYRKGYAARSDLGGGVVFSLSHELDLIYWLFGLPTSVYAITGAPSQLEMNVEDTVLAIFKCKDIPVSLSISFAQEMEQRNFSILTQNAVLYCNLETSSLKITSHNKKSIEKYHINRNDLFKLEMKNFLTAVENGAETDILLREGKMSLKMSLAIHESINKKREVMI